MWLRDPADGGRVVTAPIRDDEGMADHDNLRETAEQSAAALRTLLDLIDKGEIDTPRARVWHLRGALDALEALLNGRS